MKARDCFETSLLDAYEIDYDLECEVEWVEAEKLISEKRLDVIAKIMYLNLRDKCYKYADDIYRESIAVVTNNTFYEFGDENKRNYSDFKNVFDKLEADICNNGFSEKSIIPVDKNGIIMDGAHRLAVSCVHKLKVPIVRLRIDSHINYDINYFEKKNCDSHILDALIRELVICIPNIYIGNVWPAAVGFDEEIKKRFNKNDVDILYCREIFLNSQGAFSYIYQIYYNEPWSGEILNSFSGTSRKSVPCFSNKNPLRVFILKSTSLENIVHAKSDIRDIFNVGNHSIHITDTKDEAIAMSQLLFNANSLYFMNYANPLKYKSYTKQMKDFYEKSKDVVITGSGVMSLYGLCRANDIDFFVLDESSPLAEESHNEYLSIYDVDLSQAFYDSRYYFTYLGMKIISIDCIYKFKKRRNETKDKTDIKLIENMYKASRGDISKIRLFANEIMKAYREVLTKVQIGLIKVAHKTGTYLLLRKIYHRIIDK